MRNCRAESSYINKSMCELHEYRFGWKYDFHNTLKTSNEFSWWNFFYKKKLRILQNIHQVNRIAFKDMDNFIIITITRRVLAGIASFFSIIHWKNLLCVCIHGVIQNLVQNLYVMRICDARIKNFMNLLWGDSIHRYELNCIIHLG